MSKIVAALERHDGYPASELIRLVRDLRTVAAVRRGIDGQLLRGLADFADAFDERLQEPLLKELGLLDELEEAAARTEAVPPRHSGYQPIAYKEVARHLRAHVDAGGDPLRLPTSLAVRIREALTAKSGGVSAPAELRELFAAVDDAEREPVALSPLVCMRLVRYSAWLSQSARRDLITILEEQRERRAPATAPLDLDVGSSAVAAPVRDLAQRLELYPWQVEALDRWRAAGRCGIIEAVTGAGKTRVALAAIGEAVRAGSTVVVIVPKRVLVDQWYGEIRAASVGSVARWMSGIDERQEWTSIAVTTPHTASTRLGAPGREPGLLIADEVHRLGAPSFQRALKEDWQWRLGLTATLQRSDDGVDEHLRPYFGKVVYELGYEQAISEGTVSRFVLGFLGSHLDPTEQMRYADASDRMVTAVATLEAYGVPTQPFSALVEEAGKLASMPAHPASFAAAAFMSAFTERRQIVASSPSKLQRLAELAPLIRAADGTIVFAEYVGACREAAKCLQQQGIAAIAIDGEDDDRTRRGALDALRAGDVQAVVAPQILDEGIDVPRADLGIFLAGPGSRRVLIQRLGRVIRRKGDETLARFVIVYSDGTHEDPILGFRANLVGEIVPYSDAAWRLGPDEPPGELINLLSRRRTEGPWRVRLSEVTCLDSRSGPDK